MNSLTHTGFSQVTSRNTPLTIESSYDEAAILQALAFSNAIALMCAIEAAHIANNGSLAIELLDKAKEITK